MEFINTLKEHFYFHFVNRHFSDFSTFLEILIGVSVFLTFVDNFFEFIDKKFSSVLNSSKTKIDENYQKLNIYLTDLELTEENNAEYLKISNYEKKYSELKNSIKSYIDNVDLINSQFQIDFENKLKNKFTSLGFTNLIFLFIFLLASSTESHTRTFSNLYLFVLSMYWLLFFILVIIPFNRIKWIGVIIDFILKKTDLEFYKGFNLMKNVIYVGIGFVLSLFVVLYIKFYLSNYWFNNALIFGFKNFIVLIIPVISIMICGFKIRTIYQDVLDINFSNREDIYNKIPILKEELASIATTIEQTRNTSSFEIK